MVIVTAANSIRNSWSENTHFSYKSVIQQTVNRAEQFGYHTAVYDLGSLGIGEPFYIDNPTFQKEGYYAEIQKGYKSRSIFKPDIILHSLEKLKDFTVYLDGDALLYDSIDEVATNDFDVGVTLRRASEMRGQWYQEHYEIVRFVNAGVLFFNPSAATFTFLRRWKAATEKEGNDQKALNSIVCPDRYPEPYTIANIQGIKIKYFPGIRYNFYYFDQGFPLTKNVKILHFKGEVRNYYPFTLKKRVYCTLLSPIIFNVSALLPSWVKKFLKKRNLF